MDQFASEHHSQTAGDSFGPLHVLHPESEHTHTIVLLHGRGSTGREFAQDLLEAQSSDQKSLQEALPGWRWVFPSSKMLWSTTFQEEFPSWFEAYSLTDTTARQDLQVEGIRESVEYISAILSDEANHLDGRSDRLVLGGISQGGAIAIWSLLSQKTTTTKKLGAFIGMSTWLPFATNLRHNLARGSIADYDRSTFDSFVEAMVKPLKNELHRTAGKSALLLTPVFMGHGTDDAYVDVSLGRAAADVLSSIGLHVEWKDYVGAEEEGHWLKTPEELDDIVAFLKRVIS